MWEQVTWSKPSSAVLIVKIVSAITISKCYLNDTRSLSFGMVTRGFLIFSGVGIFQIHNYGNLLFSRMFYCAMFDYHWYTRSHCDYIDVYVKTYASSFLHLTPFNRPSLSVIQTRSARWQSWLLWQYVKKVTEPIAELEINISKQNICGISTILHSTVSIKRCRLIIEMFCGCDPYTRWIRNKLIICSWYWCHVTLTRQIFTKGYIITFSLQGVCKN